jgi:hypothetical protein
MMAGGEGWRCWITGPSVTIEHTCDTGEADVEAFSITTGEARELRDLLDEMLPEREGK